MLGDERLELADERSVAPGGQIPVDPLLETCEPQFLEAPDLAFAKGS